MKRLSLFILINLSLLLSFGCGQKGSTTNANMTLVAGFSGAGLAGQTGGTMVMGYSPSLGESFSKVFDGSPMELQNGRWDFAAISWDGNGAGDVLQGQVRCAVSRGNALTGGDSNVSLSLSTANCNDPLFGSKSTKAASGEPLPLIPTVCTDGKGLRENDPGACKNSTPLSYRVVFPSKRLNGAPAPGLVSTCVAEQSPQDTPQMENATEEIKIPLVLPGPWNFPVIIELFDDASCGVGRDRVVVFNVYTGDANRGEAELDDQGSFAGVRNEIKITKNPCSSPVGRQTIPFTVSTSPTVTYAICTPEQFIGHIPTALADSYELYRDLDFSGQGDFTNPVVNADFAGLFDGRGRTIRNVSFNQTTTNSTGLFRQIDGDGVFNGPEANVKNLTLESFTITSSGNSNGALAGNILLGSEVRNVKLFNITLNLNAATANHGGLAGSITNVAGGGNGGMFSRVSRISADNIRINATANASNIGGLIGSMNGNGNSVELAESIVEDVVIIDNTSTPTKLGGVVGEVIDGARVNGVTAIDVSLGTSGVNLSAGTHQVGGFAGLVQDSEVKDSKSVTTIYSGGNEVGGFIGASYGSMLGNVVGDVNMVVGTAGTNTGGLVGNIDVSPSNPVNIQEARSFGTVRCDLGSCGGLAGNIGRSIASPVNISSSYSKARVISSGANVGGFAGFVNSSQNSGGITIDDCGAFGNVSGTGNVGGFIGDMRFAALTNVYSKNQVAATSTGPAAGLVADYRNGTINTSYTDSAVSGTGAADCIATTGTLGTPTNVFHISSGAADGDCDGAILDGDADTLSNFTGFSAPPWRDGTGDTIALDIVATLEELGEENTGSKTDPFILTTPEQWDAIGDKPPLMTKTYRLGANISFGNGPFVPIGSPTNPFTGQFQGNDYAISDINFVDTSNDPVGLFRVIGVDANNGATRIEHEDLFDKKRKFDLFISNVNIAKDTGTFGHAGILAGLIQDNGDNVGSGYHDFNKSIKITKVNITDSRVEGGKQSTNSTVGGFAGRFTHTNGETEIRNLRIFDSQIISGTQNVGTGGIFGHVAGPLNVNSTPGFREFSTFIVEGTTVQSTSDKVGGGIGGVVAATAKWETFVMNNNTISGAARVGGIFGDIGGANHVPRQGSVVGGSVSGTTLVGGIAGNVFNTTMNGYLSSTTVSSTGTGAGCLVGQGSGGFNVRMENSVGLCPDVTAGGAASYFIPIGRNASPSVPNIYVAPSDEGLGANFVFLTEAEMETPSVTSAYITSTDPWVLNPGELPVPYWFVFPEALDNH